jgi:ABC-2 type transport system permease protein
MKNFGVTLWAEGLKTQKSKIFSGTILFFVFIGVIMGIFMYAARHPEIAGRSAVMSSKVSMIGKGDWPSFFGLLIQMVLTVGYMGFGIAVSWLFGREYVDKTIKDIISLPVSSTTIVLSKFLLFFLWSNLLSLILFIAALLTGMLTNMPGWDFNDFIEGFSMYMQSAFFNILLCTPVAFIASLGRGYLLPIAYIILSLIITQLLFVGMPSVTLYIPWALPALHSGIAGEAAPYVVFASYVIFAIFVLLGLYGTSFWWKHADLKA